MKNIDYLVRKESIYTVANTLTTLDPSHSLTLLEKNNTLLRDFLDGLGLITDETIVLEILSVIEYFGKTDTEWGLKDKQSFMYHVEVAGGYDHLEELQKLPNMKIYDKVLEVLRNCVELEEPSMVEGTKGANGKEKLN